jgi:hypothetical protein
VLLAPGAVDPHHRRGEAVGVQRVGDAVRLLVPEQQAVVEAVGPAVA